MRAVFLRELRSSIVTMAAFVVVAFIMLFMGIYTMAYNLNSGYANFEYTLSALTFVYLIAVPLLTMRCFAEERRQHTDQLLYALPLSSTKIVLGKYAALLVVLAVPAVIACTYPIILSIFGTVYLPTTYACILAFYLMGAALVAVGMFASSLCESQITAAVVCFCLLLVDYFLPTLASYIPSGTQACVAILTACIAFVAIGLIALTRNGVFGVIVGVVLEVALIAVAIVNRTALEGALGDILSDLSLFDRFDVFVNGVFDLTGIAFFLAVVCVFIFLTTHSFEKRRWS